MEATPGAGKGSLGPMLPDRETEIAAKVFQQRGFGAFEAWPSIARTGSQGPAQIWGRFVCRDDQALVQSGINVASTGACH